MEKIQQEIIALRGEILGLKELLLEAHAPSPQFLTAEEAMKDVLKCSRNTFDRLRQEGIIKVYRLRRRLYVKYDELMEAMENGLT